MQNGGPVAVDLGSSPVPPPSPGFRHPKVSAPVLQSLKRYANGRSMRRVISLSVGWILIGAGLVVLPLPIPLGLLLIILGLAVLLPQSHWLQNLIRRWRHRHPGFDRKLHAASHRLPGSVRRAIQTTEPADTRLPQAASGN